MDLMRVAGQMVAEVTAGRVARSRPLPGNELVLWRDGERWELVLRREGAQIAAEDLGVVAEGFGLVGEAVLGERVERQPVTGRQVVVRLATWRWSVG